MRALLLAALVTGCTCGGPPPVSAPPTSIVVAPPMIAPPTTVADVPTPPSDADLARNAYLAAVRAYDARDADAYFAAFEPTLFCFYGTADVPLERVRRERWHDDTTQGFLLSAELSVLSQTADEVVLRDRGFFRSGGSGDGLVHQLLHQKIVVMHRTDGIWRIAAETGASRIACLGDRIPMSLGASASFDACRQTHETCLATCTRAIAQHRCSMDDGTCQSCALDCQDAALRCLGAHVPTRVAIDAPAEAAVVRTEADVRRFATLTFGEASEEHPDAWLASARAALGAPLFRITGAEGGVYCAGSLASPVEPWAQYEQRSVSGVACAMDASGAIARCLVSVDGDDGTTIDLTLVFDGARLRAVHRDAPRPQGPAPVGLLDRYATTHPPEWDAECPATLVALGEDRVGEDFFEVGDGTDDEMATITVHRFCGAQARAAVHALGDAWSCYDEQCDLEWGCGNYCETIVFDAENRVLAHTAGLSGSSDFPPSLAPRARQEIPCGRTRAVVPDPEE